MKRLENYLGLVQFSCCIIIYRKIILGWALSTNDSLKLINSNHQIQLIEIDKFKEGETYTDMTAMSAIHVVFIRDFISADLDIEKSAITFVEKEVEVCPFR